ncbi:MAG TPA: SDR family oxidoreductase [Pseudonocardia sp.]|nr:SDR family oxidoreductase [Pseudonocardia sp.]
MINPTPRRALVTGVSRRRGIGFAIARRLLADGASVFVQSWTPHDAEQPWGADPVGVTGVLAALTADLNGSTERLAHAECDLARPEAPAALIAEASRALGGLDTLVLNHARGSVGGLGALTAEELDRCWAVNVRAALLLVQAFARQLANADASAGGNPGRVVLFTSGQHLGPMAGEIPYAATKGALHQLTRTLADALAELGATVNTVNPGPTDTGWAGPELDDVVARAMPNGRWNTPTEAAGVVALLLGPDAASITGQVVDAEGGFRRWTS